MHNLWIQNLVTIVETHRYLGYVILYFAMVIEGEVFLIIAGTLAQLHVLNVGYTFFVALAGVLTGDSLWYFLGVELKKKKFARNAILKAEKTVTLLLPHFKARPFNSIFLSKFIYGANHATLIVSGALGVAYQTFFEAEFIASLLWTISFISLGYFFGATAIKIAHNATHFILFLALFVIGFILLQRFLAYRYKQHRYEKNSNT